MAFPSCAESDSTLVLCTMGGSDDFVNVLRSTVAGKSIRTHPIEVRHVHSTGELKFCHLALTQRATITELDGSNVLLVGEDRDFLTQGGMINLILTDGRIGFETNSASLERAGIRYGGNASLPSGSEPQTSSIRNEGSRSLRSSRPPPYPDIARQMNLKGTVQLQATVRADGTVKEIHVVGGHPLLAQAAAQSVKQWRYEPSSSETVETVKISFGQ